MRNINSLIENGINYSITTVLSIFNILYIKEFILQLLELNILKDNLNFNIPKEVDNFSPYYINENMRNVFIEDINFLISLDKIKNDNPRLLSFLIEIKNDFTKNFKQNI